MKYVPIKLKTNTHQNKSSKESQNTTDCTQKQLQYQLKVDLGVAWAKTSLFTPD